MVIDETLICCRDSFMRKPIGVSHDDVFAGLLAKLGVHEHLKALCLVFLQSPVDQTHDLSHRRCFPTRIVGLHRLPMLLPEDLFHRSNSNPELSNDRIIMIPPFQLPKPAESSLVNVLATKPLRIGHQGSGLARRL